ncbi:uracil-DNA glycosylase family protein [Flavimarina sp. Hel_I_48]|uniref:uracil-DNA glycosylase family protein n=1 Tax=Flavimarina sp. Hel_I_48 TaxID=1392488 RepID=UPI0004DF63F0|nr:uracil-DNA glycosylase family protein [Flavimarina sp. Hel_I_48]
MNTLFHHTHPYPPFNLEGATKLIVGTLPPPRFTTKDLKPGDVDFSYGSIDGQLWLILNRLFNLDLLFENSKEAIAQRHNFLKNRNIGICDVVASAKRAKIDASDLGMTDVELRDLIYILKKYPNIKTLLFTGGNSKNGPEYFFRRLARTYSIKLKPVSSEVPRIHQFELPLEKGVRTIRTVSLTAPSGSANRAVGSNMLYKKKKAENASYTTIDFRMEQYKPFF